MANGKSSQIELIKKGKGMPNKLPLRHYLIEVERDPLPPKEHLESIFSMGGVSKLFLDGGRYPWRPHTKFRKEGAFPVRDVIVCVHPTKIGTKLEKFIPQMHERGYIPANEKEALAVAMNEKTCALQSAHEILAPGAYAVDDFDYWCMPTLSAYEGKRQLGHKRFKESLTGEEEVLFIYIGA